MALSAAKEYIVKSYAAVLLPLGKRAKGKGNNIVYKGAMVCSSSVSGGLRACSSDNASDLFVGIATESVIAEESSSTACKSELVEEKVDKK